MRRIQTFCLHHDIWLFNAVHVASADNLADDPSREVDLADWSVSPDIFWMISSWWGPFTVDRMADTRNAQVARFNSRWFCPGSTASRRIGAAT